MLQGLINFFASGLAKFQLTGRAENIVASTTTISTTLNAGQTETTTLFAPAGVISELQTLGFSANAPGGTTGTHVIEIFIGAAQATNNIAYASAAYNAAINLTAINTAAAAKLVNFDDDVSLIFRYTNAADANQANARNGRYVTFDRKKVS